MIDAHRTLTRRRAIRILGTGGLIAAATPLLGGCDQVPDSATAAWQGPPAAADLRRRLVSYALLAPNPHNLQAWVVDLREPDVITLRIDGERLLPRTDPFGRQVVIGQGTFLELLDLAASAASYTTEMTSFPDGVPDRLGGATVARVRLVAAPTRPKDALFDQIPHRRSIRTAFAGTPLTEAHAAGLAEGLGDPSLGLGVARDGALPGVLREIAYAGFETETRTPHAHAESVRYMRIGADQVAAHRDGIELTGPLFWWGRRLGLTTQRTMADPDGFAFASGLDMYRDIFAATPAFGWLTTPGNTRHDQLAAGRAYARLHLRATALGVALHPVSQALEEYPEMAGVRDRLYAALDTGARTVQMLVRLGYAAPTPPTARRPLEDLIVA